jgi:hypothetical protein
MSEPPPPDDTFVADDSGTPHSMGTHWMPFLGGAEAIVRRLPELLATAELQHGYGSLRSAAKSLPDSWPRGFQLAWPRPGAPCVAMIIAAEPRGNFVVSVFPSVEGGVQHTVTLRRVRVSESGLEARITGLWGPAEVSFFDTRFVGDRAQYVAGREFDFILAGLAYAAAPARPVSWAVAQVPGLSELWKESESAVEPGAAPSVSISMEGAAVLLPLPDGDIDDYTFRGPVKSVVPLDDWLGEPGWRLRTTVMRGENGDDIDLDIVVTARTWSGTSPPKSGSDIEGHLWLQGYLWMPGRTTRASREPFPFDQRWR